MTVESHHQGIYVATLNTHWGNALRSGGLEQLWQGAAQPDAPMAVSRPDILLLQEVTDSREELATGLESAGFRLAHHAGNLGLAIAVRNDGSAPVEVAGSERTRTFKEYGRVESRLAKRSPDREHHMSAHGMIALKFVRGGHEFTVATTRIAVPFKPLARRRQLRRMQGEIGNEYYDGFFVLGGDMNMSRRHRVDTKMHRRTGLEAVDLGDEPTWRVAGSKAERYYRAAQRVRGLLRRLPTDLSTYDRQLDAVLSRGGLRPVPDATRVVDVAGTDHRLVEAKFTFPQGAS